MLNQKRKKQASGNLTQYKAIPICDTEVYVTYENYCYYATYQDEIDMNATCILIPHWNEITTCEGNGGGGDDFPPGGGGSSGGGNNEPNGPLTQEQFEEAIMYNPFALLPLLLCEAVEQWLNTATHEVPQSGLNKLSTISLIPLGGMPPGSPGTITPIIARIQDINNAYSTVVNLDYFPITVSQLPIVNGNRLTPSEFLSHIRLNINNFVNTNKAQFEPYNYLGIDDRGLWNSNNPLDAVILINMFGPDNGSVIVSHYSADKWTFTTITEPIYGTHPVSGNRDFGYTQNTNGSYTFYSRGVDRLTTWYSTAAQSILQVPFSQADALWASFQQKVSEFVNQNGGTATIAASHIERPNWVRIQEVINGHRSIDYLKDLCPGEPQ